MDQSRSVTWEREGFEKVIAGEPLNGRPQIQNLAELVFSQLPHRPEDADILFSHHEEQFVSVSLAELRQRLRVLYGQFEEKGIRRGDTVLLASLSVTNEAEIAVLLIALMSYGARVLFPMFVETSQLHAWLQQANCSFVILPDSEVNRLHGHHRQKQVAAEIRLAAGQHGCRIYDVIDFPVKPERDEDAGIKQARVDRCLQETSAATECAVFTTSGTTGSSKLVVFDQGAYLWMFHSWQQAGLYEKGKMAGRSFIDILPHTVSIRALLNSLWTGQPACLMNIDWVKERPHKILPILVMMKPQVMTLGPSAYAFVAELTDLVPEIRKLAFSELHTIISTGADYSIKIASDIRDRFGLTLENAYGLTETQQVTTTLITKPETSTTGALGRLYPGVLLGLQPCEPGTYRLFIHSPFGHVRVLGARTQQAPYYFPSGDVVQQTQTGELVYLGREAQDFVKNGYGIKIPLKRLKESYPALYENAAHVDYFGHKTYNYAFGIAALICITDDRIPPGRVLDRSILKRFRTLILEANLHLYGVLEPFEYEQFLITRFLIINTHLKRTHKGTVSRASLEMMFPEEIKDLLHSTNPASGVQDLNRFGDTILRLLATYTPLRLPILRQAVITVVLRNTPGRKKKESVQAPSSRR